MTWTGASGRQRLRKREASSLSTAAKKTAITEMRSDQRMGELGLAAGVEAEPDAGPGDIGCEASLVVDQLAVGPEVQHGLRRPLAVVDGCTTGRGGGGEIAEPGFLDPAVRPLGREEPVVATGRIARTAGRA
jgi:hypothetical protein